MIEVDTRTQQPGTSAREVEHLREGAVASFSAMARAPVTAVPPVAAARGQPLASDKMVVEVTEFLEEPETAGPL